jgi:hypothetical protein
MTFVDNLVSFLCKNSGTLIEGLSGYNPGYTITTEQKDAIAAAIQSLYTALASIREDRNLPIINSIKKIEKIIKENPDLPIEIKNKLQEELNLLEKSIYDYFVNLYEVDPYRTEEIILSLYLKLFIPLQNLLQNPELIPILLLKLLNETQGERFLPLINRLVIKLITQLKQ